MKQKKKPDWEFEPDKIDRWELLIADLLYGMRCRNKKYDDEKVEAIGQLSQKLTDEGRDRNL